MIRPRGALRSTFGVLAVMALAARMAPAQQATRPLAPAPASPSPYAAIAPSSPSMTSPDRASVVRGQPAGLASQRPEVVMWRALRANPMTAPYAINVSRKDGALVLAGRVGTKQVHDAAVQMAIAFGFRFRDDLVIDTAETLRVPMSASPSMTGEGMLAPNLSSSYYVYPEPLFGWLDDPFFGMQPPPVTFAPWWGSRRAAAMAGPDGLRARGMGMAMGPGPRGAASTGGSVAISGPGLAGGPGGEAGSGPAPGNGNPANANPGDWADHPAVPATPGAGGGVGAGVVPGASGVPGAFGVPGPGAFPGAGGPMELPPPKGAVEITVDANGQVFLRGVVASAEDAREIEQTAWSVPGVSRVVSQLTVRPRPVSAAAENATPARDEPPPPPQPAAVPRHDGPDGGMVPPRPESAVQAPANRAPVQPAPVAPPGTEPEPPAAQTPPAAPAVTVSGLDNQRLTRRVVEAMKRRPAVAGQPVQVRSAGAMVSVSGKVASAYEAMMTFRAAQQTPGVHEILDRLEFPVPDEDHPNPLTRRGRPEDIEPYLAAQMARHLGDLAHVDAVKARGDHLEVRGTLLDDADRSRVLAILRSIPVLHGFTIDAHLTAD